MKISKLFHWLYAFLMFLPVFAVMVCCGYVVFNKNAKDSYYGETINQEEIVTPDTVNNSTRYLLYWDNLTNYTESPAPRIYVSNFDIENIGSISQSIYDTIMGFKDNIEGMVITAYNGNPNIQFFGEGTSTVNLTSTNWVFSFNYVGKLNNFDINNLRYVEYNRDSFLSEVFYYSLNEVYEMPVFSWAKTSFLALPITYITGLFGMASTNIVNYYLSYWLAISIVYLVFDLVIYVPLLVHRWIDKGMIE